MKLHRHREHNYVKKLRRLQAQGGLPVGVGVHQLDICPDPWCRIYKGKHCNCDPDEPKCLLLLTKRQFIQALQAGTRWKRREAFQARLAAVTDRPKGEESRGQQRESR
jgi:hypothetical protein